MTTCPKCGAEQQDGSQYCLKCGRPLIAPRFDGGAPTPGRPGIATALEVVAWSHIILGVAAGMWILGSYRSSRAPIFGGSEWLSISFGVGYIAAGILAGVVLLALASIVEDVRATRLTTKKAAQFQADQLVAGGE